MCLSDVTHGGHRFVVQFSPIRLTKFSARLAVGFGEVFTVEDTQRASSRPIVEEFSKGFKSGRPETKSQGTIRTPILTRH
ncbi:hypothetical protein HN011_012372 [Eciton burchellii]|nr:hypothetical protein HN011_012372 [Eciton burchellii]